MNLAKLCFSSRHPADTFMSIEISCAVRTFLVDAARRARDARGTIRYGNTARGGGEGKRPRYKFIFVPNFHALTTTPDSVVFTKSDVTHRRYPDDIFLAFFSLPAIHLLQPFLSQLRHSVAILALTHDQQTLKRLLKPMLFFSRIEKQKLGEKLKNYLNDVLLNYIYIYSN